jgi:hypothetical protein
MTNWGWISSEINCLDFKYTFRMGHYTRAPSDECKGLTVGWVIGYIFYKNDYRHFAYFSRVDPCGH